MAGLEKVKQVEMEIVLHIHDSKHEQLSYGWCRIRGVVFMGGDEREELSLYEVLKRDRHAARCVRSCPWF